MWVWAAFVAFIVAMLLVDLFVLHRDAHEVSLREAALWSVLWVALGLAFGALVWGIFGALVARAVFIGAGAALLDQFHWMIYVFGGFLVVTGVKMLRRQHA